MSGQEKNSRLFGLRAYKSKIAVVVKLLQRFSVNMMRGKPLGRQIPRWQGFAVVYYGCTLTALKTFATMGVIFG
jgi:hypothetical protein